MDVSANQPAGEAVPLSGPALPGFGARRGGGVRPGSHRRCRILCRPPGWAGWSPPWCWSCCRCWSSPVGCVARRWRSPWSMTRWSGGWPGWRPGLLAAMQVLAALGSWTAITVLLWGLLLALLILRRLRQLLVVLARLDPAGLRHPVRAGAAGAAAAAVRGGVPDRLVRLGAAVRADGGAGRSSWWGSCTAWCRRAAGARPASGWRPRGGPGRRRPHAPGGGGAHRRAGGS